MTIPDLPADRPIPDTTDLRLLAELINNAYIPLANAAWNARMSQAEAAARLVSMAERGLPLRLVADGDRQALWHIAQAGPATSGVAVTGGTGAAPAPVPAAVPGGPGPVGAAPVAAAAPADSGPLGPGPVGSAPVPAVGSGPVGSGPVGSGPVGSGPVSSGPVGSGPVTLPPPAPVPPHEQAIAGAVPLGEPPFGQPAVAPNPPETRGDSGGQNAVAADPPASPDVPVAANPGAAAPDAPAEPGHAQPPADHQSTWGPAGSSSWARADDPISGPSAGPIPPRWQRIPVAGPGGEQLTVTILDVIDPGDRILTDAGFRMEPGKRAVLVHSSVQNTGQVHYYPVGDLYLVLETATQQLLGRDAVAVASHPAFPVGVAPGRTADGWSVFLIPADTVLAGLKWCIRPDIPQTIVSWPIAP